MPRLLFAEWAQKMQSGNETSFDHDDYHDVPYTKTIILYVNAANTLSVVESNRAIVQYSRAK